MFSGDVPSGGILLTEKEWKALEEAAEVACKLHFIKHPDIFEFMKWASLYMRDIVLEKYNELVKKGSSEQNKSEGSEQKSNSQLGEKSKRKSR